tara:strand:+ start:31 stop:1116 length:1086 start_codon:yes stop_codon:yes gene_type:complete
MENQYKEEEIDLIAFIKSLWLKRKFIYKTTIGFAVLGIIIALLSPVVYTASSTFITQSGQKGSSSSLSGVASLVGINLGSGVSGNEIPPSLYPQIIESVTYKRALLDLPIANTSSNSSVILKDYLLKQEGGINVLGIIKKYTIMLPFTILNAFKGEKKLNEKVLLNEMSVSLEEESLFNALDGILSLNLNSKEGFVNLSASMKDPVITANIARGAQEILQKSIIDYKIKNASEVLIFNQTQVDLKKIVFDSLQDKLALFKDSNINIVDSRFVNKLNSLESEFNLVNVVYQELNKQLEQSKLQVSRDTPVFSVIKPVTIPNVRSAPNRKKMVLVYTFIGFIIGCGYVLIKKPLLKIISEIKA